MYSPQSQGRSQTASASPASREPEGECIMRALVSNLDGHRNVVELERFAHAMDLDPALLERLRTTGLGHSNGCRPGLEAAERKPDPLGLVLEATTTLVAGSTMTAAS